MIVRVRVTPFRFALGWAVLGAAGLVGGGCLALAGDAAAKGSVDASRLLRAASAAAALPLAGFGAFLLLTSRVATYDPAQGLLTIGRRRLERDRLRALLLLRGPDSPRPPGDRSWSVALITAEMPGAVLSALKRAGEALAGADGDEVPARDALKADGVLAGLRSPPAGGLCVLLDAASGLDARETAARFARAASLPVLDLSDPRDPRLRRHEG